MHQEFVKFSQCHPRADMNSKQAKDVSFSGLAEQAALKGLTLSDLEKRMIYFTESTRHPARIRSS